MRELGLRMTQRELAQQIGTTECSISHYVTGTREPKAGMIAKIATALHTTTDYLLGIESDPDYHCILSFIKQNTSSMGMHEKRALLMALVEAMFANEDDLAEGQET